jgi:hypothetical protein
MFSRSFPDFNENNKKFPFFASTYFKIREMTGPQAQQLKAWLSYELHQMVLTQLWIYAN